MSRDVRYPAKSFFRAYPELLLDGSSTVKRKDRQRLSADSKKDDDDILESYGQLCRNELVPYQPRTIAGYPIVSLDYAAAWYPHVRSRYNIHTRGIPCAQSSRVIADMTLDPVYPEKFIQAIQGHGMIDVPPEVSGLQVFKSNITSYYYQDCIMPRPRHTVYDSVKVDQIVATMAIRAAAAPPPPKPRSFSRQARKEQVSVSEPVVFVDSSLSSYVRKNAFKFPTVDDAFAVTSDGKNM